MKEEEDLNIFINNNNNNLNFLLEKNKEKNLTENYDNKEKEDEAKINLIQDEIYKVFKKYDYFNITPRKDINKIYHKIVLDWDDELNNSSLKKIKKIFLPKNMNQVELTIKENVEEEKKIRKWLIDYIWIIVDYLKKENKIYINKNNKKIINNLIDDYYESYSFHYDEFIETIKKEQEQIINYFINTLINKEEEEKKIIFVEEEEEK
jgi:hypothetical protein